MVASGDMYSAAMVATVETLAEKSAVDSGGDNSSSGGGCFSGGCGGDVVDNRCSSGSDCINGSDDVAVEATTSKRCRQKRVWVLLTYLDSY
ncbi:hypothetical protein Hanom_Chr01g00055101 [Helianthus anomalus]